MSMRVFYEETFARGCGVEIGVRRDKCNASATRVRQLVIDGQSSGELYCIVPAQR